MNNNNDNNDNSKAARPKSRKPKKFFDASERGAASFAHYLDPTEREVQDALYVQTLSDPQTSDPVGIPLSIGGLNTKSTITQVKSSFVFIANASGDAWCSVFGHAAAVDGIPVSSSLVAPDGLIPAGTNDRQSVGAWYTNVTTAPSITPGYSAPMPVGVAAALIPAAGLSLVPFDSECRLVSCEFRVFPTSSNFVSSGTGMMIRPAYYGGAALLAVNYNTAYAEQASERVEAPLASWKADRCFRALWHPERLDSVQFCTRELFTDTYKNPMAIFFASGCVQGQTFRAELFWTFEQRDQTYSMSRYSAVGSATMAELSAIRPHMLPHVATVSQIPAKAADAVHALALSKGPERAKAFWAKVASGGKSLLNAGIQIAPSLIELASVLMKNQKSRAKAKDRIPLIRL